MAAPTLMPTSLSRAYPVVEYGRCNGGEGEALWIDPMDATEIERFNGRFGTDFDTTSMKDRSRFGDILTAQNCWATCELRVPGLVAADFQYEISDCNCYTECDCLGFRWVSPKDDTEGYLILPATGALPPPCAEASAPTYAPTPAPRPTDASSARPQAPPPYARDVVPGARRPQRWSRQRRPQSMESPMKNFYAQSLSIFMLIALLACALSCARSLLRRCGAYLVARTLEHRDSRAIADRGERVSLVVADPELCASGAMEIG